MPVRLGLIGAGRWGKVYIRTLLSLPDRCRLTHLCTSKPENAALIPHPVTIVPGWRELIAADCDAVIIATPPQTHAELLEACVKAGKPCVVEKPLCFDVATAERLDRLVQAAGIPVLVDHTHVLTSAYETLKRTVKQAGEPVRMVATPVQLSKTPARIRSMAPELGQHSEEVLLEAGYSQDEIESLRAAGVMGPGR